jgi:monofunctional biosynthetic peptidoglycan transglycosylase
LLLAPVALFAVYRFVPPPGTPLMLIRLAQGEGLEKRWKPLDEIAPSLAHSVIAAEDNLFCRHGGFDWKQVQAALDEWEEGGRLRGASTITMQTAKNLLLWPGQSWLRKGVEAYLAAWLELLWPKRRILEVYLNVAEWGPGVSATSATAPTPWRCASRSSARCSTARTEGYSAASEGRRSRAPSSTISVVKLRACSSKQDSGSIARSSM